MRSAVAPQAFSRRPSMLVNQRDLHQLIEECNVSLQVDPTCLHTLAVRGHACMKAKLWNLAIRDFSHILHCRPDDIHGRFSRGMAFFKTGHIENAHMDFSRVLELNPHHVMARYARAGCYNTEGEFHEAILDYTIALEHDEKEHESTFRIEKLHRADGISTIASVEKQTTMTSQPRARIPSEVQAPALKADGKLHREPTKESSFCRPTTSYTAPSHPRNVQLSLSSSCEAQPSSRAPRKVVQVRVNLSEFADSSCQSTIATRSSEITCKPVVLPDQQPVVHTQAQPAQQASAIAAPATRSAPAPKTPPLRTKTSSAVTTIPSTSTAATSCSAALEAPTHAPLQLHPQQPRVIRKVTVTL